MMAVYYTFSVVLINRLPIYIIQAGTWSLSYANFEAQLQPRNVLIQSV